jgi:hypothetical protein
MQEGVISYERKDVIAGGFNNGQRNIYTDRSSEKNPFSIDAKGGE